MDDKLFSFWLLQGDSYPLSHVKGIYRFETGIKVNEFRDLRANPRCLLESQILSFRVRWSRMIASGVRTGFGDEWVRVGAMKMTCDGSISERTARLAEPYVGRPDDFARANEEFEDVRGRLGV